MADPLNLTLDPETERELVRCIDKELQCGRFELSHGRTLVLDGGGGDPATSALVSRLKDKLGKYIDFDTGGLKLLELDINGAKARFTVVPGWESAPQGVTSKSLGGPSIALRFTVTW